MSVDFVRLGINSLSSSVMPWCVIAESCIIDASTGFSVKSIYGFCFESHAIEVDLFSVQFAGFRVCLFRFSFVLCSASAHCLDFFGCSAELCSFDVNRSLFGMSLCILRTVRGAEDFVSD